MNWIKTKNYFWVYALVVSSITSSCIHDPFPVPLENNDPVVVTTDTLIYSINTKLCDPDTVYFSSQILPIFISYCAIPGCHDAQTAKEGVVLTNYPLIRQKIKPGNLNDSEYYTVLITSDPEKLMPRKPGTERGDPLSAEQIGLIRDWILQGAKNTFCDECDTTTYTFAARIKPIFEQNCSTSISCHAAGSVNGDLTNYTYIKQKVEFNLIQRRALVFKDMPPANPLPDCERLLINLWIDGGALNN